MKLKIDFPPNSITIIKSMDYIFPCSYADSYTAGDHTPLHIAVFTSQCIMGVLPGQFIKIELTYSNVSKFLECGDNHNLFSISLGSFKVLIQK